MTERPAHTGAMAKARRKHPAFNTIEETPQGRYFLLHVFNLVGGGLTYVALERLDDNSHVFRIEGERAWGLLVERPERRDGDSWTRQWGFRLVEPVDSDIVVQARLSARRWDPWLAYGDADDSPVRTATRSQRRQWDEQRARSGAERDRLELTVRPRGRRGVELVDVADKTILDLAVRHRPELPPHLGAAAQPSPTLRERVQAMLLETAERVEVDRDGDFSVNVDSSRVFVRILEMEPAPVISVWSVTNVDLRATPELFAYVATNADRWLFGHLGARTDEDGSVYVAFSHRLFGEFLHDDELLATVQVVGATAAQIADDVRQRFGGRVLGAAPDGGDEEPAGDEPPTGMYL